MAYDILIKGGRIYDGSGLPSYLGDVAINDGRIVETGREHNVTVEQNAVLAQALSAVELDDEIPEELYRATAQVIAFVLSLRGELGRHNRDGLRT